jgi:hypothetical protein
MKDKILEISDKLRNGEITEIEAREEFLFLFGVTKRTSNNELKPSGFGIVVDKSKATKEFPMIGTAFRKGSKFNWSPNDK